MRTSDINCPIAAKSGLESRDEPIPVTFPSVDIEVGGNGEFRGTHELMVDLGSLSQSGYLSPCSRLCMAYSLLLTSNLPI